MTSKNNDRFVRGAVFGAGILVGMVASILVLWGLFAAAGAATSAYEDACSTTEVVVELQGDEPVVHIEDREPAWFCVTTTDSYEVTARA